MIGTKTNTNRFIYLSRIMAEGPAQNIKKILLAEDDDDDFDLLNSAILSINSDMEILRTTNGVAFSSLLETSLKPDVIILDLNMPFKNGITCVQEIKTRKQYQDTAIIIYSTSCTVTDIEASYKAGANFYLIKPVTYTAIVQQFKSLFSNDCFVKNIRPVRERFVLDSVGFSSLKYN